MSSVVAQWPVRMITVPAIASKAPKTFLRGAMITGSLPLPSLHLPVDDGEHQLQVLCDLRSSALMHFRDDASAAQCILISQVFLEKTADGAAMREAARRAGIELILPTIEAPYWREEEYRAAFTRMAEESVDGVVVAAERHRDEVLLRDADGRLRQGI